MELRWSIKEDAEETRKRQEEKANQTAKARASRKEEPEEKKRAETAAIYEIICGRYVGDDMWGELNTSKTKR